MLPVRRRAARAAPFAREDARRDSEGEKNLSRQEKNPCIRISIFYNSSRSKKKTGEAMAVTSPVNGKTGTLATTDR